MQLDPALVAGQAALGEARRLVDGAREALVAAAARAGAGHDRALAGDDEVVARAVEPGGLRPGRHPHDEVLPVGAVAQRALAVAPALRLVVGAALEGLQVAQRVVAEQDDVPAAAAVAAVGAAARDVRLAPEGEAAVPAPAPLDEDPCPVVQHATSTVSTRQGVPPCPTTPSCSSPAPRPASARPRPVTPPARATAWSSPRAARTSSSALAAELGGEEDRVLVRRCDVTEWDDQQALAGAALERFGRIDAVFANAGFGGARGFLADDPERWRAMVLTNVYGAALTIRATLEALRETRGHLLLTGSVAGRKAMPGSLYSCTKWAVTAMGEALRQEVHGSGVRVTVIEPGAVETPFWDDPSALQDPLTADDVAEAVMFALSRPPHVDVNEILVRPTAQPV